MSAFFVILAFAFLLTVTSRDPRMTLLILCIMLVIFCFCAFVELVVA
jgi:hypothetical protein